MKKTFVCKKCGFGFTRSDSLLRHHRNGVCGKSISKEEGFNEKEAIAQLSQKGYAISKPQILTDIREKLNLKKYNGKKYVFGCVSDMHLGSKFQQLSHLYAFYARCEKMGIDTILNAGDITAGIKVYKGMEFEIFLHGADAQIEYVTSHYPHIKGIQTILVGGNHDYSHWKNGGIDICRKIADERKDIRYLGMDGAYLDIGGISIYLHHSVGGNAYARSYKLQKVVEQFAPEQKPHILVAGHYHTQVFMPMYRNVMVIQMPCFEAQTPYLKRKGLYPEVGGVVIEMVVDDEGEKVGLASFKVEFVPFYVPIEKDY